MAAAPPATPPATDVQLVATRDELLQLCHDLSEAGIWLYLQDEQTLIAGPPELVQRSPALLQRLRLHKAAILRLLDECLVSSIFGAEQHDARFLRETCPECQRRCFVIAPPRRLEAHRLPDNQTICPGSERAQALCADLIMQAFVADCCVPRAMSVLTWYSLRGALTAWCTRHGWLLPPRPALHAWLDTHYTRLSDPGDEPVRWAGLTLTVQEWLGDDEDIPHA